jgi:hypothetical protein
MADLDGSAVLDPDGVGDRVASVAEHRGRTPHVTAVWPRRARSSAPTSPARIVASSATPSGQATTELTCVDLPRVTATADLVTELNGPIIDRRRRRLRHVVLPFRLLLT